MPVRPSPYHYQCVACAWEQTFAPESDVIDPSERPKTCPQCGALCIKTKLSKAQVLRQQQRLKFPFNLLARFLN